MQLQRTLSSPIKSVQRGQASSSGVFIFSVSVTPVNMAKASLEFSWRVTGTTDVGSHTVKGRIDSVSSLYFVRGGTGGTLDVEWELIEYV